MTEGKEEFDLYLVPKVQSCRTSETGVGHQNKGKSGWWERITEEDEGTQGGAAAREGERSLSLLCEYTDKSIKPVAGCSDEKDA